MSFRQRTHSCGELRAENAGQTVTLNGWAHKVRNLGGLFFVDVRDRKGITQAFFDPATNPEAINIKPETCITVTGKVTMRDENNRNANIKTGDIEIVADSLEILNPCGVLPFPISDEAQMAKVNEELRVKHRYLDLRRPTMHHRLALRAAAIKKLRAFLDSRDFVEVETPIFTKSTPEGARDYLVPYRLEPGLFYALPQSPQQYKQLLMVGGVERYYQIAKCFRDEAQRSDRQPEFTQLDLEMSFVTQEDILELTREMTLSVINELIAEFGLEKDPIETFERMTYDESLRLYGNDKPDLRFGLQLFDVTEDVKNSDFGVFKSAEYVRGVRYPGGSTLSRKDITEMEDIAKSYGAKGMATIAWLAEGQTAEGEQEINGRRLKSGILKFLKPEEIEAIMMKAQAEPGDLLCFAADKYRVTCEALARLRIFIGDKCGLRDKRKMAFAFIVDFPLVDWNEDEQRWDSTHHPFTSPKATDLDFLESDPGRVRADCYDVVCNGTEWASGSIRIHRPDIQARAFSLLGIDEETQRSRFGHILDAFSFGAPPHGGIAPGIDRMIMFLTDDENIREVIAFPKMGNGLDPMMDAPSPIDERQWQEVGLQPRPVTKA
jgi:aspartyl-tRNA synthetase